MQSVDTKAMLAFTFSQMQKLDKGEISNETACAQAKLMAQANNTLNYELKRSIVQIKLHSIGAIQDVNALELRDIETKDSDESALLQLIRGK